MTGVHRLQHVESFAAATFADDDPVRAHAQRVAHEVADLDRALALNVRRTRLEPDDVPLPELQLGRVFDRYDPLIRRNESGKDVEERRLARRRPTGDQDAQLAPHRGAQEL